MLYVDSTLTSWIPDQLPPVDPQVLASKLAPLDPEEAFALLTLENTDQFVDRDDYLD